jgi:hypothetical protein
MQNNVLTNFDLEELFHKHHLPLVGIFSKDQLPYKKDRKPGCYVLNLQDEYDVQGGQNAGTHWTCFYVEGRKACYMDPFGMIMPRQVQEFLADFKPYPYSTKQIQDITSQVCGWYCFFFCHFMVHQKQIKNLLERMNRFLHLWDKDPSKNRDLLIKYLDKINAVSVT